MNAKQFFNQQSPTDSNNCVVDKYKINYSQNELISFAEAYHKRRIYEQWSEKISDSKERKQKRRNKSALFQ